MSYKTSSLSQASCSRKLDCQSFGFLAFRTVKSGTLDTYEAAEEKRGRNYGRSRMRKKTN